MSMTSTQFAQLIAKFAGVAELKAYFEGARNSIDAKKNELQQAVFSYIDSARSEYPIEEITKNMQMRVNSSTGTIEGFSKYAANCSVEHVVNSNVLPENRPIIERELLAFMSGNDNTRYIFSSFNIVRVSWNVALPESGSTVLTGIHYSTAGETTIAAFVKPISGDVRHRMFEGLDVSNPNWQLCGLNSNRTFGADYQGNHPSVYSPSGEVLVALAGVVRGHVDLSDPKNWGLFGILQSQSGEY